MRWLYSVIQRKILHYIIRPSLIFINKEGIHMKKNLIFSFVKRVCSFLPFLLCSATIFAQSKEKGEDWLTFNRTYDGDRFSPLKQITTSNVKQLRLLHTFDLGSDVSSLQTGPVVVNGILYFTTDTTTYAINAATGKLKWKSGRPLKEQSQLRVNRGVAFYDNKLFRGSGDAHVYALNAESGK